MKRFIKKYSLLFPILILNIISLYYLYKTDFFIKQCFFYGISFVILISIPFIKNSKIIEYSKYLYLLSNFLLLLVLIIGREIKGAKAWLHIYNISIQPSEIAKLALILYLSYLTYKNISFFKRCFLTFIPSLLTFLEPDTGAIIIYLIILLSTLKFTKIKKIIAIPIGLCIIAFVISHIALFFTNKELLISIYGSKLFYRIDRIISFKNKDNLQAINSTISIGANKLLYIPENHNDFIFAAIISKYPIVIFFIILLCYIAIFYYLIKNIQNKKSIKNVYNFILLNILLFQIFYNIFMNLSLVPIIGIPLPFLSYGGSGTIILYCLIGFSIYFNNSKDVDNMDKQDIPQDKALDLHKQV